MGGRYRKDRVYVTTELNTAKFFAAGNSALSEPAVYEVEPVGDLEEDADRKEPGLSFACEKAKILSVHKVAGKDIKKARKAIIKNIHRQR
jgi:rifampin ADP-ribosylating transferase